MDRPALSIVLSTHGFYDTLKLVLDGYERQNVPHGTFELILVVDVADPDPDAVTRAVGERSFPLRRLVGSEPGLSSNRNTGIRAARAPIVLLTDNDTVPMKSMVREHLSWHERHPEENVAILGKVRWAREGGVTPFMRWLDSGLQFNYANLRGIDQGPHVFYGANVSIKRTLLERVGDFDQHNLPYGYEDYEWAYRARDYGLRVLYNRKAVVEHHRRPTLEFWLKKVRRVAQAEHQFIDLHPEVEPWYQRMFEFEAKCGPTRGRSVQVARFVPPWVPVLGPKVWESVDKHYKRVLAPHFIDAWNAYEAEHSGRQPDLAELADAPESSVSSLGFASSGPK
jgi:GT2 family glycosyltransferase